MRDKGSNGSDGLEEAEMKRFKNVGADETGKREEEKANEDNRERRRICR